MGKKILKASAGTGKTYRLSIEYIVALLKGESYKDILVMTFTKKATSEIIERVVKFLKLLSSDFSDEDEKKDKESLIKSILQLYPEVKFDVEKIKKINEEVNSQLDDLKIYTIDSFIGKIFRGVIAPHLGIENYTIIDQDEEEKINFEILEIIFKDKKKFNIFKEFLDSNFEKNVDNYAAAFKSILAERWKYLVLKESALSLEKRITQNSGRSKFEIIEEILLVIGKIRDVKGPTRALESYVGEKYKHYLDLSSEEKLNFVDNSTTDFLESNIWNGRSINTRLKGVDGEYNQLLILMNELRGVISVDIYINEIIPYEKSVLEFIDELYNIYDELKVKEGKLSFQDVTMYTFKHYKDEKLNLFKEGEITEYFKQIFDSKITTLFIDEFQDTSVLQWKILKGVATKTKNVFCVGDEKQSLYGWRGGEKELFEKLSIILNAEEENLDTSYRSDKGVIEFTNKVFQNCSKLYGENIENIGLKWDFLPVKASKEESGYIEIIDGEVLLAEMENFYEIVAETLLNKFQGNYKEIAIIARTGKDLSEIATVLSDNKISYILKSKSNIFIHRVNDAIFKLLKYLAYNSFFSLLEFLRSDLIMIDSELLKDVLKNEKDILLYLNGENEAFIMEDDRINQMLSTIKKIKIKYNESDGKIESFIIDIFSAFEVLKKYNGNTDIKNYYRFLEITKDYDSLGDLIFKADINPNNPEFAQVSMEESNSVTLSTIHGSKGLEYDTVIYIHNPSSNGNNSGKLNFYLELDFNYEYAKNFIICNSKHRKIISNFKEYTGKNDFEYIIKEEYKKEQEELNNWYVAMTRAKKNLFVILVKDKTLDTNGKETDLKKDNLLHHAIKNMENINGVLDRDEINKMDNKSERENKNNEENTESNESFLKLNFSPLQLSEEILTENSAKIEKEFLEFSISAEESKTIGTIIHYYLENLNSLNSEDREKAKVKTLSQYGGTLGYNKLKKILEGDSLKQTLENNKNIFSKEWDIVYNEYEVMTKNNELRRIDKILVKRHTDSEKGIIKIIDYKTGEKDEEQLAEYREIIGDNLKSEGVFHKYNIESSFIMVKY